MISIRNGRVIFDSNRRLQEPVNLVEMASRCSYSVKPMSIMLSMSTRQLERMFFDALGVSPKFWLRQQRMIRARYLIREGFSLKEVASNLGFRRYSHFITEVRAFYGVAPGEMLDFEKRLCSFSEGSQAA